jgi:UPF0716 protein FxsA
MLWKLILLLTAVPLVELFLLVRLTQLWDSLLLTILLVIVTGIVGATLTRLEGLRVLHNIQHSMERGELPADGLMDGVMILVAGALLITPGVLTDAAGFLLVIPFTRVPIRNFIKRWMRTNMETHGGGAFWHREFRPIEEEPPPGYPPMEDEEEES